MNDPVLGPVKGDVTAECVLTALSAGRAMRTHQKEYFATRQQAAAKRVVVSKTETTTVGNAAAMREALKLARDALISWLNGTIDRTTNRETIKAICAALSAPARNCDVGTAEEQSVRMSEFCREQYKKTDGVELCSGCRFHNMEGLECQFAWAQTPYAAEKGAGNDK